MLKEKKEILHHLTTVAYNKIGAHKIVAFLLGQGIIKKGEKVNFKQCEDKERYHTFDEFYKWYTTLTSNEVLTTLLEDLGDRLEWAIDNGRFDVADRVGLQLEFLVDALKLDMTEEKLGEQY